MTLAAAQQLIIDQAHLIGAFRGKTEIEEFAIVPMNGDNLGEIVMQVLWEEPYLHLLAGHNDFKVIALLDLADYPNSGILLYEDLEIIINE
jgi:hypothetical protein